MLNKAIKIAVDAHDGCKDKADAPYILHPLRVMMKMISEEEMITAVLHDVVEDNKEWSIDRLRSEGFSENILDALDNLTKRANESYEDFIQRTKKSSLSRKVKLADLEDNMDEKRIAHPTEKDIKRLEKYQRALLELKGHCS